MVLMSQRDGLGSASQAPRDRTSGTREATDVPAVGAAKWSTGARLGRQCVPKWGLSAQCNTYLAPRLSRGAGGRHRVLGPDPAAHRRRRGGRECGDWVSCTAILALLGPGEKETALFLRFWVPLAGEPVAEQNKKETKDSPPGPPPGGRSGAVTTS